MQYGLGFGGGGMGAVFGCLDAEVDSDVVSGRLS